MVSWLDRLIEEVRTCPSICSIYHSPITILQLSARNCWTPSYYMSNMLLLHTVQKTMILPIRKFSVHQTLVRWSRLPTQIQLSNSKSRWHFFSQVVMSTKGYPYARDSTRCHSVWSSKVFWMGLYRAITGPTSRYLVTFNTLIKFSGSEYCEVSRLHILDQIMAYDSR